jgi:hypothetical protein
LLFTKTRRKSDFVPDLVPQKKKYIPDPSSAPVPPLDR